MLKNVLGFGAIAALAGCQYLPNTENLDANAPVADASSYTLAANAAYSETLPWDDVEDEELSSRGFIATLEDPVIRKADGSVVIDLSAFDFATGDAPDTVNPSLWRHLKLIKKHGLFEVADGIYQVRGFDLSVMSVIEGETGYIVIDPLLSTETAAAAMELVRSQLGDKPIHAVIYTHSHADHFGGAKGIVSVEDVKSGRVKVLAPEGFLEHSVSENIIAGPAMTRRSTYQFGRDLKPGPLGLAGSGIGTQLSVGSIRLLPPSHTITRTGERMTLDGVEFVFQVTPGAEAPAEMNFYLPGKRALCLAENANVTMHNVLTPRGALVRDAQVWAHYLTESQVLFGGEAEVLFNSHGWPRWGQEDLNEFIASHRDAYKYLHDQSVRLMNKGLTEMEIAEQIALPEPLAAKWYNRGYYGTMSHNSKAVYQRYLGWYDGNPTNLNPLPPEDAGARYVEALGGAGNAVKLAREAYAEGDYRWAAELANRVVFADDSNTGAREVLAQSFEQMAYQAEGMLWRNMYLMGAKEARTTPGAVTISTQSPDMIAAVDTKDLLELIAIKVDPVRAAGKDISLNLQFPERKEAFNIALKHSVLVQRVGNDAEADATLTMPRLALLGMLVQGRTPEQMIAAGALSVSGDGAALGQLLSSLEDPAGTKPFEIVSP